MRKSTKFFATLVAFATAAMSYAGVNPTTAWFNGDTFESNTLGEDLTTAGASPWSGWTKNAGYALVQNSTAYNYGSASGQFLGFSINNTSALAEVSASGGRYFYKAFPDALSGLVYVKSSFYTATGGNYSPYLGTTYTLRNTAGTDVFTFGGAYATSNALFCTGVDKATMAMGVRAKWADVECVLDIANQTIVKVSMSYNGTTKTYRNLVLPAGTDIKTLYVAGNRGYVAGGLDNTTIGQLMPDAISAIAGDDAVQSMSGQSVNTSYKVALSASVMDTTLVMNQTDAAIAWSVSDWGTLSSADQALVNVTADVTDSRIAALSVGSISANATITLKAEFGSVVVTKDVNLKAVSLDGLKLALTDAVSTAKSNSDAVTDVNPYITSAKGELTPVLSAANVVIATVSSTIEDFTMQLSSVATADSAFGAKMVPYNAFVAAISKAQATNDAEVRTAVFFVTVKGTLSGAIATANTAKTTVASAGDIAAAQTAVVTAEAQFVADIPAYAVLETQIATVTTKATFVTARSGANFLSFQIDAVDALKAANDAAIASLASATTAADLTTANTTLTAAVTSFDGVSRVAPVDRAYTITTWGVDNGDGGSTKYQLALNGGLMTDTTFVTDTLVYTPVSNEMAVNTKWLIKQVTMNTYTIQNKATGNYLTGVNTAKDPYELSLIENTSSSGSISAPNDSLGLFLYSIKFGSKILELNDYVTARNFGNMTSFSGIANRLRFCFQFEAEYDPTATVLTQAKTLKAYALGHQLIVTGLTTGNAYGIYDVTGQMVKAGIATADIMTFELNAGIYILRSSEQTMKMVMR